MGIRFAFVVLLMPLLAGCLLADLKPALAEPNLEKRSRLALDNAAAALDAARAEYAKGDNERVAAGIAEFQQSVDLAFKSLEDTRKNPRRSPKWFKYAEIHTRNLLRKLDAFERDMSYADRSMVEQVKADLQQIHDRLLVGLVEGKPK
jgi:hypothetical protein